MSEGKQRRDRVIQIGALCLDDVVFHDVRQILRRAVPGDGTPGSRVVFAQECGGNSAAQFRSGVGGVKDRRDKLLRLAQSVGIAGNQGQHRVRVGVCHSPE